MLLDVAWQADDRPQSWVGRVRSVDRTSIVGEPIARFLALPATGTFVRVTTAVGSFPSMIAGLRQDQVVFERPVGVSISNRRTGLRVRASAQGRWWPEDDPGAAQAIMVVDLSLQGARVVSERLARLLPGRRMIAEIDGRRMTCEVRSVVDHEHPRLSYYGIRYVDLPDEVRSVVHAHVTRARQDPKNWL
jgi:hypothetical protein